MEIRIEQISSDTAIFNNVVLNGSTEELIEYMKTFNLLGGDHVRLMSKDDIVNNTPKITDEEVKALAENINLDYILIDSKLLKPEDRTALLNSLPNYINGVKRMESSKLPPFVVKAHDSVCAYVFKHGSIENSLEFTIAKYNKLLFDRTNPANILSVYRIDGKYLVVLTKYPIREW